MVVCTLFRPLNAGCRPVQAGAGRAGARRRLGDFATLQGMHPIVLLGPLSDLRHSPDDGFTDNPEAFEYKGATACVRFDKGNGRVTLDPPDADLAKLLQELQALAQLQHDAEKARLLERIRQRRLARPGRCE